MEKGNENENGSNTKSVSANDIFDQMSNQGIHAELQRLGIQACESTPKEFLLPLLKFAMELKVKPLNATPSPAAPVGDDCEAFFCSICIVEYSPTEQARIPRNLECGHSFCTNCLMQSRNQHCPHGAPVTYGIKCPTCRSFTRVPAKDDVKALPKNFTAIAMLQSTKKQSIEALPSKRRRFDGMEALANAVRMCELLEGRPEVSKDLGKAFQMAEEGSQAGCVHSMGILGRCYITGLGVGLDKNRGLQLGRESAIAGSAYGEFVVAFAYETGSGGVQKDLLEAVEHYKVAVQHGIAEAQYCLAQLYIKNRYMRFGDKNLKHPENKKQNEEEAQKLLNLASKQGHADSQISLAMQLCDNYSTSDYELPNNEALMLLKLGLKQGSARSHLQGLHKIAYLYSCLGDHVEAFNHYKLASDQGHSQSSFQLAKMHQYGNGVIQSVAEALNIYMQVLENSKNVHDQGESIIAIRDLYLERGDNAKALKWCKRGADEGVHYPDSELHLELMYGVARMYQGWDPRDENYERLNIALEGDGIERDFVEAAKYYKLACESFQDLDISDSAYQLAKMCEAGLGVPQNYTEAVRLLNLGVAADDSDAIFHLACMYEEGRGIAQDLDKAASMFKDLMLLLDNRALCRLASMYRDGRGVVQNKQEALRILKLKCLHECPDASYLHASMLLENVTDLSKDPTIDQVTILLNLAASENHADAQYMLACQLTGGNVEQKIELLKSASKSNMNAMFKLACMLADGEGVACDDKEAAKLFMSAVSKGHVESHCRLADMFEHGKGVVQCIEIAAFLYRQAAEKKNVIALCNLARMHTHGLGVIQSHSEAFKYCSLAAVQGFAQAKYDLACMYLQGIGTAVVRSEGLRWLNEAAAEGHHDAAAALRRLIPEAVVALPQSESQRAGPIGIALNCSVV